MDTATQAKPKRKYTRRAKPEAAVEVAIEAAAPAETPAPAVEKPQRRAPDPSEMREKPDRTWADKLAESRKVLTSPPPPGMAYFEAPDGYIIMADEKHDHVLCRSYQGKGDIFINKRR